MKATLKKIIEDQETYGRFLNTLSLLEYIGARKILKSQPQQSINEQVLAHASEELRHAQVLKRVALKSAPETCQTYEEDALYCGREAYEYFQTVDQSVEKILGEENRWHAYLLTTLLIELRATDFYQIFESVLQTIGKTVFRGILVEEEKHLHDVTEWSATIPDCDKKIEKLKEIEAAAFGKFTKALETNLVNV